MDKTNHSLTMLYKTILSNERSLCNQHEGITSHEQNFSGQSKTENSYWLDVMDIARTKLCEKVTAAAGIIDRTIVQQS
jgi:hypothetical protein